ncbi:MAG: hypothetical protein GXY76_14230 [Chloroflexi bacterium]|nr:hypothetical protein [Chloroflexota bacterium]
MVVLNYSHPLTQAQVAQLATATHRSVAQVRVRDIPANLDPLRPFDQQAVELANLAGLTAQEWQGLPIVLVPPSLNFGTAVLLAELEGRMGHLPAIVRRRPVARGPVTEYEIAEIINLQEARLRARARRNGA